MGLLKSYKVNGSSITESIMAMVIIAICLAMSMTVYVRVLQSTKTVPSIMAEQKIKELLMETELKGDFSDEDFTFSTYKISKRVSSPSGVQNAYQVDFTIMDGSGKRILKHIIYEKR